MSLICKICSSKDIQSLGSIDFGRINNPHNPFPFGKTGIKINYLICNNCNFIFTSDMDDKDDMFFKDEIYNKDYYEYVDPDYKSKRSDQITPFLLSFSRFLSSSLFLNLNSEFTILDYGSGNNKLFKNFKNHGIEIDNFDPYDNCESNNQSSEKKYDLIFAIEVFEHEIRPKFLIDNLNNLIKDNGIILFSTKLSKQKNINWNYIAPRNGHVSIYSSKSLNFLASQNGLNYYKLAFMHIFSKQKLSYINIFKLTLLEVSHRLSRELLKFYYRFKNV